MTVGDVAGAHTPGVPAVAAPWRTAGYLAVTALLAAAAVAQSFPRPLPLVALAVLVPAGVAGICTRHRRPWLLPLVGCVDTVLGLNVFLAPGLFSLLLRRRDRLALALVVLAAAATTVSVLSRPAPAAPPLGTSQESLAWLAWGAAMLAQVGVPVLVGGWLGTQRALVRNLQERAVSAEAERKLRDREAVLRERERIASEMHDALGHQLTLVAMHAGALTVTADTATGVVGRQAEVLRSTARRALVDLRQVVGSLQDGEAEGVSSPDGLADMRALVADSSQVSDLRFTDTLPPAPDPPRATSRAVFRIVQEGLTNAHRHAPGGSIDLLISGAPGAGIDVLVSNQLAAASLPGGNSTGLAALAERVRVLGGSLTATRGQDRFELAAHLPWPRDEEPRP